MFGQRFDGPVPAGIPGLEEYRLRVWLFSPNPDGLFADANPAEACLGSGLVAPHAYEKALHEVLGVFSVDPELVRDVLDVPAELHIRTNDLSGQAEVWVGARSFDWSSTEGGTAASTKSAATVVPLQAPDWTGESSFSFPSTAYPFSWVSDRREYVDWWRRGMGVGADVIRHNPDLVLDFDPPVGGTGFGYRFTSPDFVLEATATDTLPVDLTNSLRYWHESPRGMGLVREWVDAGRGVELPPGAVIVTPTPGTPLAELLRACDPGPTPGSCTANRGIVITSHAPWAWTASVSREWWNPRHAAAKDDALLNFSGGGV